MRIPVARLVAAIAAALAAVAAPTRAAEPIFIQVPAVYDADAAVDPTVRRECRVEERIGDNVLEQVSRRFPETRPIADPGAQAPARLVRLTILHVRGVGGGAWSGSKTITIRADWVQDGTVRRSQEMSRGSWGGMMGNFAGTCPIMERIAVTLGRDAAT